jgi:hypothetical protein
MDNPRGRVFCISLQHGTDDHPHQQHVPDFESPDGLWYIGNSGSCRPCADQKYFA